MPASKPRRKDDPQTPEDLLDELLGLLDSSVPSDATLARLQKEISGLQTAAQAQVRTLDKQLDKLAKATAQLNQESNARGKASKKMSGAERQAARPDVDTAMADADSGDEQLENKAEMSANGEALVDGMDPEVAKVHEHHDFSKDLPKHFVPNPKSEFVPAQTLPVSALSLFEETEGDEGKKKKLGVVSYPTRDLQDELPGPVPDEDFTRAKPPNQVQFTTFATFLEPYFRLFTEEDLSFLQQKSVGSEVVSYGRTISPYTIPPLGPLYTTTWAEEDGPSPGYSVSAPPKTADPARYTPAGGIANLTDDDMEVDKVAVGPLTARLMSALLPENGDEDSEAATQIPPAVTEVPAIGTLTKFQRPFQAYAALEDRLRREFMYVGIVDLNILRQDEKTKRQFKLAYENPNDGRSGVDTDLEIDWVNNNEDDEVSRELRDLQAKLRHVSALNLKHKRRLLPIVEDQMAWQEYSSILDDLDKQVDQSYLKRLRVPKSKKKKPVSSSASTNGNGNGTQPSTPQANSTGTGTGTPKLVDTKPAVRTALDKRQRWITKIGAVFPPPTVVMRTHEVPKFTGDDDEDDNENDEEE